MLCSLHTHALHNTTPFKPYPEKYPVFVYYRGYGENHTDAMAEKSVQYYGTCITLAAQARGRAGRLADRGLEGSAGGVLLDLAGLSPAVPAGVCGLAAGKA